MKKSLYAQFYIPKMKNTSEIYDLIITEHEG